MEQQQSNVLDREWASKQDRGVGGRKVRKIYSRFPWEADRATKIAWAMANIKVYARHAVLCANLYTLPENFSPLQKWYEDEFQGAATIGGTYRRLVNIHFGNNIIVELRNKSKQFNLDGFPSSAFAQSLRIAEENADRFRQKVHEHRQRLIHMLEERDGVRGCVCGCGATEGLEFDHMDPATKRQLVSVLLQQGQWSAAEEEARACCLRAAGCHRMKTTENKEYRPRPRSQISSDPVVEANRARSRATCKRLREYGRERLKRAKLKIGRCQICSATCDEANMKHFDFDHVNPSVKNSKISELVGRNDGIFYREVALCRLLCRPCHINETKRQWQSGRLQYALLRRQKAKLLFARQQPQTFRQQAEALNDELQMLIGLAKLSGWAPYNEIATKVWHLKFLLALDDDQEALRQHKEELIAQWKRLRK